MDQWGKVRRLVLSRDGNACLRCLAPAEDVHHRRVKGMGGTSDSYIAYGMANLVSLCRECHNRIHAHPQESYATGYLVHSWDDPAQIPVVFKPGTHVIKLLPSGDIERVGGNVLLF